MPSRYTIGEQYLLCHLSAWQRDTLSMLIGKQDPELFKRTEEILRYIQYPRALPDQGQNLYLKEVKKIYDALSDARLGTLNRLDKATMIGGSSATNAHVKATIIEGDSATNQLDKATMIGGDSATQALLDVTARILNENPDPATIRKHIGRKARKVLEDLDIPLKTTKTGSFAKYLQFISDVSGLKFNAHKLTRTILDN